MQTSPCRFLNLKVKEQEKLENTALLFRLKKNCNQNNCNDEPPKSKYKCSIGLGQQASNYIISYFFSVILYTDHTNEPRGEYLATSISIEISRKPQTSSSFSSNHHCTCQACNPAKQESLQRTKQCLPS